MGARSCAPGVGRFDAAGGRTRASPPRPSAGLPPPPPPSRTKWTRLVHPCVLIGHVSSRGHTCLSPTAERCVSSRTPCPRATRTNSQRPKTQRFTKSQGPETHQPGGPGPGSPARAPRAVARRVAGRALWLDFGEAFCKPLGAADYVSLAAQHDVCHHPTPPRPHAADAARRRGGGALTPGAAQVFFLSGVPALTLATHNEARRPPGPSIVRKRSEHRAQTNRARARTGADRRGPRAPRSAGARRAGEPVPQVCRHRVRRRVRRGDPGVSLAPPGRPCRCPACRRACRVPSLAAASVRDKKPKR